MAQVVYSKRALQDLERLAGFLGGEESVAGVAALAIILDAIDILGAHPLVGRSVEQGLRELVISRGRSGYLALYSFERREDVTLILAVHHQREAGFLDLG